MRYIAAVASVQGGDYVVSPFTSCETREALNTLLCSDRAQKLYADPDNMFWVWDQYEACWYNWTRMSDGAVMWTQRELPPHRLCVKPIDRRCHCEHCTGKRRTLPPWVFLAHAV